ncbi:MAG: LD-carboxypeptidase [Nitriliruptor sp.]|nr:MAG: LD-carboxypeptidase [Nitriliruptor sp.]
MEGEPVLIKPQRLRAGDQLAAVSLSWGGPGTFPHRYEAGKRQLEDTFGVEVVEMPHTLAGAATLAADPGARADDLHRAFADPDIAGVVSTIGGDDSIRLLPHLDLELLAANPKVFLGYSDSTVTQMALLRAGVTSYYGPSIMAGFGENAGLHGYLVDGVRRTLFDPVAPLNWPENREGWTVEQPDWSDPANQHRRRGLRPSTGWRWHGGVAREGVTVVGCLEVLDFLRGTKWWPSLDGVVLVLETSEDQPPPESVTYLLRTLALTGELQRLAGLVLGRPGGAELPVDAHVDYDTAILRVVRDEEGLTNLPVVTNVDVGHTDPMWTVPQGVRTRIDPTASALTFLEPAVR